MLVCDRRAATNPCLTKLSPCLLSECRLSPPPPDNNGPSVPPGWKWDVGSGGGGGGGGLEGGGAVIETLTLKGGSGSGLYLSTWNGSKKSILRPTFTESFTKMYCCILEPRLRFYHNHYSLLHAIGATGSMVLVLKVETWILSIIGRLSAFFHKSCRSS